MIAKPQVKSLNYIRQKDAKHAEALDDLITAIANGPSFSDHETPSGPINGANKVFRLAHSPNPAASLHFYKGGALLTPTIDYILAGNAVTLTTAPALASVLAASYRY